MSRKIVRGGVISAMLLGTVALTPGLASAAGATQTQPQPAAAATQQNATVPGKSMTPGKTMASRETTRGEGQEVKVVQEALNKGGAKLAVDGRLGAKTREALKAFQSKNGLTPTGRLDKATEAALKLA
jgi:peptidoglycan hydrolase-like protein with peptidoglycan-binding domain